MLPPLGAASIVEVDSAILNRRHRKGGLWKDKSLAAEH